MPEKIDFQNLSIKRLNEAKALLQAGHNEGAFYLAGYAVELALKAAACTTLDIEIFNQSAEVHRGFKTHRIDHLIVLAGLSRKLATDSGASVPLQLAANGFIVQPTSTNVENWDSWTEETRYNKNTCSPAKASKFIENADTFVTWIRNHW